MGKYGFKIEEYDDGTSQKVLMTGDGKSTFSDVIYENGDVGIAFSYGAGVGVGTTTEMPTGTTVTDINAELVVRFEKLGSIDSMIATLDLIRNKFIANVEEINKQWVI